LRSDFGSASNTSRQSHANIARIPSTQIAIYNAYESNKFEMTQEAVLGRST